MIQVKYTPGNKQHIGQLIGSAKTLYIKQLHDNDQQPIVLACPNNQIAQQTHHALSHLIDPEQIHYFPDWETLPYDMFSPHQDIISQRLRLLQNIPNMKHGIIVTAVKNLMQQVSTKTFIDGFSLHIEVSHQLDITAFSQQLIEAGYRRVETVIEHGEFCVRGSLVDLFPMGTETPYRIELFDDEIETIRSFDPDTQRSTEKVNHIHLLPAKEFPFTEGAIRLFRQQWRETFNGNPANCPMYQDISDNKLVAGIEYYLPLFFDKTSTLFDFFPKNTLIIHFNDTQTASKKFWTTVEHRYDQLAHDITRPILAPNKLYLNETHYLSDVKKFSQLYLSDKKTTSKAGRENANTKPLPTLTINHQSNNPLDALNNFIEKNKNSLICANSKGRQEILHQLLNEHQINHQQLTQWPKTHRGVQLITAPLQQGFIEQDFALITENDLFGEIELSSSKTEKTTEINEENLIRNLVELNIDDPVVHLEHGVGRYRGLETIDDDEYLLLEYAEENKLYVPVASLNLISRYASSNAEYAPLHYLGGKQWEKAKEKAAKKIYDVAAELLQLYAKRASEKAFACEKPNQDYHQFEQDFDYTETQDQQKAINDVIHDMSNEKVMDRLICGDVGFGKTEVAMRAAFLAVQNSKQVAMLVPTTLLAQQHYDNFCDRFAKWPVVIESLSRFRSAKQQQTTLEKLKDGKVDIIIGTHRLLQKDIAFNDLGLMIIDEEHRFGVKHKEQLKRLRANIDTLTLTATPIPRTLNLSLSGMRDLSLIATPPAKRLAIKTFVSERKDHIIREAANREIMRGGQVYFLHNNVQTIEKTADELSKLIPQARIAIAHGQMRERQLEKVMNDFYHRHANILVCTTIIESGIDVPSANTIIIDRADKLGLAQLHQLRGRVGRSHHQAYAYLLTPGKKAMTSDAKKRLNAIAALEDLGIGFTLATHDLEIRGAGELLGSEQSGRIEEIGFSLYMELLEKTVQDLKAGRKARILEALPKTTVININESAIIPKTYLADVHARLTLYKRIAGCNTKSKVADMTAEIIDRFGPLPEATSNLLAITELKLQAKKLGISSVDITKSTAKIDFAADAPINPQKIVSLLRNNKHLKMEQGHILKCQFEAGMLMQQRIALVGKLLRELS